MKVAVPADVKSLETAVCRSFGRAPYYLIHDLQTNISVFIENPAARSQGGAGVQAAQILVDQQLDAVLTPRLGRNAAEVIQAAGIQIYQSMNRSLRENLDAFSEGKLNLLQEIHAGFHRHGGHSK